MVGMVIERRIKWIFVDLEVALFFGAVALHTEGGGISSLQKCVRRLFTSVSVVAPKGVCCCCAILMM